MKRLMARAGVDIQKFMNDAGDADIIDIKKLMLKRTVSYHDLLHPFWLMLLSFSFLVKI